MMVMMFSKVTIFLKRRLIDVDVGYMIIMIMMMMIMMMIMIMTIMMTIMMMMIIMMMIMVMMKMIVMMLMMMFSKVEFQESSYNKICFLYACVKHRDSAKMVGLKDKKRCGNVMHIHDTRCRGN
jgi:hypothetical protein